jgi:hypothetical protein
MTGRVPGGSISFGLDSLASQPSAIGCVANQKRPDQISSDLIGFPGKEFSSQTSPKLHAISTNHSYNFGCTFLADRQIDPKSLAQAFP